MARWVLRCDPTRWRIYDFVAAGHPLTSWALTRADEPPRPGDEFALWVTGRPGGVVALGRVTGPVADDGAGDDRYWTDPGERGRYCLPIHVTRLFLDDPLPRDALAADPDFAAAAEVLHSPPVGDPYPLTGAEWAALQRHLAPAAGLLRGLIGTDLTTAAGRTSRILAVRPPDVIVATGRAPHGQPVPLARVDRALRELRTTGRVEIRSAFVGAVLRTLPGARVDDTAPPAIRLDPPATGPVDRELRDRLFGARTEAMCALCGDVYPVGLLVAAHIKKRAACTDLERRDLDNIAIPACALGCDALYEAGYLTVDRSGHIIAAAGPHPRAVAQRLDQLARRRINAHTPATEPYFRWHRDNTFIDAAETA